MRKAFVLAGLAALVLAGAGCVSDPAFTKAVQAHLDSDKAILADPGLITTSPTPAQKLELDAWRLEADRLQKLLDGKK